MSQSIKKGNKDFHLPEMRKIADDIKASVFDVTTKM